MAIGVLISSVHRQDAYSVRTPPTRRPTALPPPATAPKSPNASARSLGWVNVTVSNDNAAGAMTAANAPCSAREPKSMPWLTAAPPRAEAAANPISPMMKARFRPV